MTNSFLLDTVLKKELHYPGWVMSDWGAVHDTSCFGKGLDQESGSQLDRQVGFGEPLRAEVAASRVSRARVSEAVRRILRSLYAVGADRAEQGLPIDFAGHAAAVREVAANGLVLLKNEGAALGNWAGGAFQGAAGDYEFAVGRSAVDLPIAVTTRIPAFRASLH